MRVYRDYLAERVACINGWTGIGIMIFATPSISFYWAIYLKSPNGLWTADGPIWLWWAALAAALAAFAPRIAYEMCRLCCLVQDLFFQRADVSEEVPSGGD